MEIWTPVFHGIMSASMLAPIAFHFCIILYSRRLLTSAIFVQGIDECLLPIEINPPPSAMLFATFMVSIVLLALSLGSLGSNDISAPVAAGLCAILIVSASGWCFFLYGFEIPNIFARAEGQRKLAIQLTAGLKFTGKLSRIVDDERGVGKFILKAADGTLMKFRQNDKSSGDIRRNTVMWTFAVYYKVVNEDGGVRRVNVPLRVAWLPILEAKETEQQPPAVTIPVPG